MLDVSKGNDPWGDEPGEYGESPFGSFRKAMRLMGAAILRGHEVVPCDNTLEWAAWCETANRHVGDTKVTRGVRVSTVFLGLDHSHGRGKPKWFETMTFRDRTGDTDMVRRYTTWEEAEAGHARTVERERRGLWAYVVGYSGKLERQRITMDGMPDDGVMYRNRRRVPFQRATLLRHFPELA